MTSNFFNKLGSLLSSGSDLLDKHCTPNPKYAKGALEQGISRQRNKAAVIIYILVLIFFLLDWFINGIPLKRTLFRATALIIYIVFVIRSRNYHPYVLTFGHNILWILSMLFVATNFSDGIYIAFVHVVFVPTFVHMLTGSVRTFIFQGIGQTILLNVVYRKALESTLAFSSPQDAANYLVSAANISMLMQLALVSLTESLFRQAYKETFILEQKKKQAENQKVFLLGFSHELRNLINSLTGNVKLATFEKLPQRAKDLHNAEVCGELLLHMINNILDTGKTEIGELEINPVSTSTYDTFEKIWGICSELIKRKDLKGSMKIPKDLPHTLKIDHHRLTQIFLNLVGNAIKFTDTGSIDISISWISNKNSIDEKCFQPYPFNISDDQDEGLFEKENGVSFLTENIMILSTNHLRINKNNLKPSNQIQNGILKIVVTDTGCGMTQDQTSKLFQRFSQVTSEESKKKLGTGLGLFISRQLCQKMKGEIKVFSQKDRGTSFMFCIPAQPKQESIEDIRNIQSLSNQLRSKALKAMIVDDIPNNHSILKVFFEKLGIQVVNVAVNGLEAFHKYQAQCIPGSGVGSLRIVTMDIDMPIMDGKEAAKKIREFEEQNNISPCFILMISGNCDESEISECVNKEGRIRANAFLRKPINFDDFRKAITAYYRNPHI